MARNDKSKSLGNEIIRFAVVGVVATLVDLIINYIFVFIIPDHLYELKTIICTTMGFIGGVIINYILSTIWVFQNVKDEKEAKSKKSFILFVLLSAIGLILGIELMSGFNSMSILNFGYDLYSWEPTKGTGLINSIGVILKSGGFYLFTLAFCIKTLIVLVFNYISRKKLIYKAPKEN